MAENCDVWQKAANVLKAIKKYLVTHEKSKSFQADNGSRFVNKKHKTNLEKSGIHHV